MSHKKSVILLTFITVICLSVRVSAQSSIDRMISIDVVKFGIAFSMPNGYMECDSGFLFQCRDAKITNAIVYSIVKKDSSVKIGISFVPVTDSVTMKNLSIHYPQLAQPDPNTNYLITAKYLADTSQELVNFYDSIYVKKTFNANHALSFIRKCRVPHENYENHRIVFIAKNNICHVELTYLYTNNSKGNIEEEIRRTEGMIRFK